MLPEEFADLERFAADWCLPTESERFAKRLATPIEEMQAFYDAITPRAEEAIAFCDKYPLDGMPDDVVNLMHLLYSMIMVSFPVECWGQAHIPDTGAAALEAVVQPGPCTRVDRVELSCGLPPGPHFADLAVLAEEHGYARVWIFDSAPLWEDPFVHLALAAVRTTQIDLATAVLIPTQRPVMTMASGIATIARLSGGRFRACFGTGYTARKTIGQPAMSLNGMFEYVTSLRRLLAGETITLDGKPARMLHAPGMTAPRPIDVPLWVSVLGPRGNERAPEVADGTIGPPHSILPTATMVSGTVLDPGEDRASSRVREAIGPWRVMGWHTTYAVRGQEAVDEKPGGRAWRTALEALAPDEERHLLTFEGHCTYLPERDRALLEHIDVTTMVGDAATIRQQLDQLAEAGFSEIMYTPSGPDVARELRTFAAAHHAG